MSEKHTVAMFVQGEDGRRVQVGWASPKNASGVRTFEYSPGYEETRPRDVSFEDDDLSLQIAEEQHGSRKDNGADAPEFEPVVKTAENAPLTENLQPAEPVVETPDAELAAEPVDADVDPEEVVELDNGGKIVDPDEDEEAEFQRLLAEEAERDQPQTRREARENEENN